MIPRLKPTLDHRELLAALTPSRNAVPRFEERFAQVFQARHGIAFPYGRSALWAFLKAVGLEGAEVILPAYTCSVVAHAIALSGNRPRFVDVRPEDYNMDLDQVEEALSERTGAVIATHLFGFPLDVVRLQQIVRDAERRWGRKIYVVQDCAHSFGATWQGRSVASEPDVAMFGLNVSKVLVSVFGGMLTTRDDAIAEQVRAVRQGAFHPPPPFKGLRRLAYLALAYPTFQPRLYGLVHGLQHRTPLLDRVTKAFHRDEAIAFPPDGFTEMCELEARVGLAQLEKYPGIVARRREHAAAYDAALRNLPQLVLPPAVAGATYSHYPVRVSGGRARLVGALARQGIELGEVIQYSVVELPAYRDTPGPSCPHASRCAREVVNLPVYPQLRAAERSRVIRAVQAAAEQLS